MKNIYDKIIKNSVKAVKKRHKQDKPKILDSFYIGDYNKNPRQLVIFYVFKTDSDLQYAKDIGLFDIIEKETMNELIAGGYPEFAFEAEEGFDISGDTVITQDEELVRQFIDKMNDTRATVLFMSEENVKDKADGSFHEFLQ